MKISKFKTIALGVVALSLIAILSFSSVVYAQTFATGNHFLAANDTTGATWADPQSGKPGEVIEFRMLAQNQDPNTTINNVKFTASLPSTPGTTITASATISADNAASFTDTATINVTGGEQQGFAYIPGHVRIFSASCPSGCVGPDTITSGGVSVGNLAFGESAQVLFKAYITNNAQPTPTPAPQGDNTNNNNNTNNNININSNNQAQVQAQSQGQIASNSATATGGSSSATGGSGGSSSSTSSSSATGGSVTITTTTTQPAAQVLGTSTVASTLPKTGPAPIALAGLGGMVLAGWRLKNFGQDKFEVASTWLKRTIDKA